MQIKYVIYGNKIHQIRWYDLCAPLLHFINYSVIRSHSVPNDNLKGKLKTFLHSCSFPVVRLHWNICPHRPQQWPRNLWKYWTGTLVSPWQSFFPYGLKEHSHSVTYRGKSPMEITHCMSCDLPWALLFSLLTHKKIGGSQRAMPDIKNIKLSERYYRKTFWIQPIVKKNRATTELKSKLTAEFKKPQ